MAEERAARRGALVQRVLHMVTERLGERLLDFGLDDEAAFKVRAICCRWNQGIVISGLVSVVEQ